MKRTLLTTFFALQCVLGAKAQPNHNVLQVVTAVYTELNGDKAITPPTVFGIGDPYEVKDLYGETFNLYGKPWLMDTTTKGILIFPNAFIEIVEPGNFVICDGMLRWLDSIDNNSKISYKIEGASGNKILKVQWKNLKIRTGQASNFVNMQIWLYQKDGMVEYRYGPSSANNASGYTLTTGPSVGISYSDTAFASFKEKIWIYGTPPNIQIDSARTISFPNISGIPANGTVYRFIPKQSLSVATHSAVDAVKIYPNPVNESLIITADNLTGAAEITITDIEGRTVKQYQLSARDKQLKINTAQLTPGNYHILVRGNAFHFKSMVTVAH